MGFNFPNAPTIDQLWPSPPVDGQPVYRWDGEKWTTASGSTTTAPPASALPLMDAATAAVGVTTKYAREDHVHPSDVDARGVRFDAAQSLTVAQRSQARANIDVTKKNYVVNGAMMVSQENGTAARTMTSASGLYYPVDMFHAYNGSSGTATCAQIPGNTPGGSSARLRISVTVADAAVGANDILQIIHRIEGFKIPELKAGTASAKVVTLQFGCKGPAGTYCVSFSNSTGARSYVANVVISAGEANTEVVKSVTLTMDTLGTWFYDNVTGIDIRWFLMGSSSVQTATVNTWITGPFYASTTISNFMGTVGNVFELFDVSLTEGTVAPPFAVPDYARELAACQRYFYNGVPNLRGFVDPSATNMLNRVGCNHPVVMRAVPTHAMTSPLPIYDGSTVSTISLLGANTSTTRVLEFEAVSTAAMTAGKSFVVYQGAGGNLNVDARL